MKSITAKASEGFLVFLLRNIVSRVMGLLSMIVLARLLTPYDFGLVSITEALVAIIGVIGMSGIPEFLLSYRKNDEQEILQAAFWFNVFLTLLILIVFLSVLPFWAQSNNDTRIVVIGGIVGCYFFFNQLQGIPKTILSRKIEFKAQVRIQTPFLILLPIGKIICAYAGLGVYSLVLPTLVFSFIQMLLFFRIAKFRPKFNMYRKRWGEIFSFSKNLIGTMLLSRIVTEGDKIILASVLGIEMVGIYAIAIQLVSLFPNTILPIAGSVLNAVLPSYAHNNVELRKKFFDFLKLFGYISVPIQVVIGLIATPLVEVLYGPQWSAVVLPFQILCIYSILRLTSSSLGTVLNSINKPHVAFYIVLIYTPLHILTSYIFSFFGVVALAAGVVGLKVLFLPWELHRGLASFNSSIKEWLFNLKDIFVINGVSAIITFSFIRISGIDNLPAYGQLIVVSLLYFIVLYLISRFFYLHLIKSLANLLNALNHRYGLIFKLVFQIR